MDLGGSRKAMLTTRAPSAMALARAQEERHAGPAPVVHPDLRGDERLHLRVGRDAGLVAVALVLAAHDLVGVEREHGAEHLALLLHQARGSSDGGGSIATTARICMRCVTIMSRNAPVAS